MRFDEAVAELAIAIDEVEPAHYAGQSVVPLGVLCQPGLRSLRRCHRSFLASSPAAMADSTAAGSASSTSRSRDWTSTSQRSRKRSSSSPSLDSSGRFPASYRIEEMLPASYPRVRSPDPSSQSVRSRGL